MKSLSLAIGLLALSWCGASRASPFIVTYTATDSSWLVTSTGPAATWNNDFGYDVSGWESATWLYDTFSSADGIWAGDQYGTTNVDMWARQLFNVEGLPAEAWIYGGLDDDGEIYINGSLVHVEDNGYANDFMVDITPYLVTGVNLIAYHAYDNWMAWGYNHSSWLEVSGLYGVVDVPTPAALTLFGFGLLALRKKHRA